MGLSYENQFKKILSSSEHILIALPQSPSGDIIGAGFGLAHFAASMGLTTTVAFRNSAATKEMYNFLPTPQNLTHSLTGTRDFTITFRTEHNDITSVRSERTDDAVHVHVTPERGMIESRDFTFGLAEFPYSVIVAIGSADKEAFGTLFTEIPDLLYDVPLVNIDNKSENEHYGQLNIITLTASSCSEIIAHLCEHVAPEHITQDAAQCLLTGIISATDSFRAGKTTPKAMSRASALIDRGADQHAIVTHLYKSQPLSLLKLWGITLSKLEMHNAGQIISTLISRNDFETTNTDAHYLPQIIDKVKQNHVTAKFFIVIYEKIEGDKKTCIALIDAQRYGDLPEETFGKRQESGFYETTFTDNDCNTGREKIASLIENATKQTI